MHQPAEFSWTNGPCIVTDSRASDRYLYVNATAVPEWTVFGPVCSHSA
jgi:hypothetical protein